MPTWKVKAGHMSAQRTRLLGFTVAAAVVTATFLAHLTIAESTAGDIGPDVILADPAPLPPAQPTVPGLQGAPFGPQQLGSPGFPNGPSPRQADARGVGVGTNAELGGPLDQMPGARPGLAPRSALGTGPSGGVSSGVLPDLDAGGRAASAPTQTDKPPTPTFGIGGNSPWGLVSQLSGPTQ